MRKAFMLQLCTCLFLCLFLNLSAQKNNVKFGKIDKKDLEMTQYPGDSSAHAAILYDYGDAELVYETGAKAFRIEFYRHIRFKILDKSGYDYANFSIPLYQSGSSRETVGKIKAVTYNLENGSIVESKFEKKDIIKEEVSENRTNQKIVMPNVKEGSIIEIQYSVRSPFTWNLWDWQFQYMIPVKYSEYKVAYPEWFHYTKKFKGYDYEYITVNDESTDQSKITMSYIQRGGGEYTVSSRSVTESLDYMRINNRWVVENMPAFKSESYISSARNYLFTVDFELASLKLPNSNLENFTKNWEDINKSYIESERFGEIIDRSNVRYLSKEVKALIAPYEKETDKIAAITNSVKEKMLWDGRNTPYTSSQSLKKIMDEGKGTVGDINLLLVAMLRAGDFEAYPVILSTRSNGYLNPLFPSSTQFNYVIAAVKRANGKLLLLDGTNKNLPYHILPTQCINDRGRLISEEGGDWVDLSPRGKYRHVRQCKLKLNEEMEWEGSMKVKCRDYAAYNMRMEYANEEKEEDYIADLESASEGLTVSSFAIENVKDVDKEVVETLDIRFSDQVMDAGDMLYFNPMLDFGREENPFKLEERKYPVDYNYPIDLVYSASFEIPEGYTIEEVPEQAAVALPAKGGRFSYNVMVNGNTLTVTNQFKINKYLYLPEEYAALRQFYDMVVEKHGAQVVLKKKT